MEVQRVWHTGRSQQQHGELGRGWSVDPFVHAKPALTELLALSTTRPVNVFLANLDLSSPVSAALLCLGRHAHFSFKMVDDMARHPEVDNFSYIQLLLESFNKLGRLDVAVESIEQRLPTELFRLVDRTNTEIEQQHRNLVRPSSGKQKGAHGFEPQDVEVRETIISDLLTTLYSKFEAIAEGHRVLHDIIEGILRREDVTSVSLTGSFNELWKLYQNEVSQDPSDGRFLL